MTVSIMHGSQLTALDPFIAPACLAERLGIRLWLGQSFGIDTHDLLSALAGHGIQVDAGIAVAVAGLRTPTDAALRARSVAALSGRRLAVAYGIGTPSAAARLNGGTTLRHPASFTRDYVGSVRALLDGSPSDDDLALPVMSTPEIEVGCGVLRPRMATLAGGIADFAVTWLTPLPYLQSTLIPALEAGARTSSRRRPRVVSILQCALDRPGRSPATLAATAFGMHLAQPHYRAMLEAAGVSLDGHLGRDLRAAVGAGLFAYGAPSVIADTVRAHLAAGVDEVVLNTGAVGIREGASDAVRDLEEILDAVDFATLTSEAR